MIESCSDCTLELQIGRRALERLSDGHHVIILADIVVLKAASAGRGSYNVGTEAVRMEAYRAGATWCGGALERGDGAALEPLAQLRDALGGVGAAAHVVEAAEHVA